jgi:hypothetical protein
LKEIALDLLEQYRDAKEDLIWEYSGSIDEDTKRLEEKVAKIRQEIEDQTTSGWITGRLPDKPCVCLAMICGDSIGENFVVMTKFIAKPYHYKNAFLYKGKDISDEVLAWQPLPEPYQEADHE